MLLNDPSTAGYLKNKFGEDYGFIVGDEPVESKEPKIDLDKIREQERTKAQAEAIKAQMQLNTDKILVEKAKELGFTSDEFSRFKEKVELLGGDEQAIQDAALIVNQTKATAKTGEYMPDGGEAEKPVKREVTITKNLDSFAKSRGIDRNKFASELDRVKSLSRKDSKGNPIMELPPL
jgi:hypothetical protein